MTRAVEESNRRLLRARDVMDLTYGQPLKIPALAGIWIPLRGRLQYSGAHADGALLTGELRITEAEPNLHVSVRGNALWVALLGNRAAWRTALAGIEAFCRSLSPG